MNKKVDSLTGVNGKSLKEDRHLKDDGPTKCEKQGLWAPRELRLKEISKILIKDGLEPQIKNFGHITGGSQV